MWKKQFAEAYFNPSIDKLNIEEAFDIKQLNLPSVFYKFRPINVHTLDNIKNDTIWFANPSEYNDPYDSSIFISSDIINNILFKEKFDEILKEVHLDEFLNNEDINNIKNSNDMWNEFLDIGSQKFGVNKEETNIFINNIKRLDKYHSDKCIRSSDSDHKKGMLICSFSEIYSSIIMWSHYADFHRGICIGYDSMSFPPNDLRIRFLYPIIYSDKLFDYTPYLKESITKEISNVFVYQIAAMHKSTEWAYEKEWRIIFNEKLEDKPANFFMPTPKVIYLGSKVSDILEKEQLKDIVEISRQKGIDLYQMHMSNSEFKLIPEKI